MMAVPLLLGLIEACEKEKERRKMSKVPSGIEWRVTPEQAYAGQVPRIPEGWAYRDFSFGPLQDGERFLDGAGDLTEKVGILPRLVVKRVIQSDTHADWEMQVAYEASILAGISQVGMVMGPSHMQFAVSRLRKIDLAKILAVDLAEQIRPKQNPSTDNYSVREVPRAFGINEVEAAAQKCGISLLFNVTHNQVKAVIDFIESLGYRVPEKK